MRFGQVLRLHGIGRHSSTVPSSYAGCFATREKEMGKDIDVLAVAGEFCQIPIPSSLLSPPNKSLSICSLFLHWPTLILCAAVTVLSWIAEGRAVLGQQAFERGHSLQGSVTTEAEFRVETSTKGNRTQRNFPKLDTPNDKNVGNPLPYKKGESQTTREKRPIVTKLSAVCVLVSFPLNAHASFTGALD
eukprot:2257219-Amphidinium_carterae.1